MNSHTMQFIMKAVFVLYIEILEFYLTCMLENILKIINLSWSMLHNVILS